MSLKSPETFGEKYLYGPILRAGKDATGWVLELPFKAINSIISGVENAVFNVINGKNGKK
ncbi:hypothetical protein GF376_03400 [Candidatus Peregrinibacteria bacterium]|nr:hypothetical protein [Candidatus Peregrinibacteria bacterium]